MGISSDIEFYDKWHQEILSGENALKTEERQRLLRALMVGTNEPYLVVGCGSNNELTIIPLEAKAIGIDISHLALQDTRRLSPEHLYVVADAARLPFRKNAFKTIVCSEVIEHVRKADQALSEFRRIIQPSGQLILSTPNWVSFYGIARYMGRIILRRDLTSGDQPYDRWSTKWSLREQLLKARFNPSMWIGLWFFPPFGKGRYRLPDRLIVPFLHLLLPLERRLRHLMDWVGHILVTQARPN